MNPPTTESVSQGCDLRGKTAIVTGANAGLGREVCRVLALRGAHVVLACRDMNRAATACQEIIARHGEPLRGRMSTRPFDGDSMASAIALVDQLARDDRTVDWVFLNAGVFGQPFRLTPDGHEATLAINYLAHFLLVHRLLTTGQMALRARVIASLSEGVTHNPFARADLSAITDPKRETHRAWMSSPDSKILMGLFLTELARRTSATPYANMLCIGALPPATLTNNVTMGSGLAQFASSIIKPFFRPVEQGAACLAHAAVAPDLAGPHARFIDRRLLATKIASRATESVLAQQAWETTERTLRLEPWPGL